MAFFMKKSLRYWVCFGQRVIDFMKNRLEVFFNLTFPWNGLKPASNQYQASLNIVEWSVLSLKLSTEHWNSTPFKKIIGGGGHVFSWSYRQTKNDYQFSRLKDLCTYRQTDIFFFALLFSIVVLYPSLVNFDHRISTSK